MCRGGGSSPWMPTNSCSHRVGVGGGHTKLGSGVDSCATPDISEVATSAAGQLQAPIDLISNTLVLA